MNAFARVRSHIEALPAGQPFVIADLLDLGSRSAVDSALSRLVLEEAIMRVCRGVYVRPRISPWIGRVTPGEEAIAQAVAASLGATVVPHGAAWALRFGLTTQVMLQTIYLTDGPTRHLRHGRTTLTLRHASARTVRLSATPAGGAVLALEWLLEPADPVEAFRRIRAALSPEAFSDFLTEALATKGWIARTAREFMDPPDSGCHVTECPGCGASWLGDPIPDASRHLYGNATHFLRLIAIYSRERDRTVACRCPDCGGNFDRYTFEPIGRVPPGPVPRS